MTVKKSIVKIFLAVISLPIAIIMGLAVYNAIEICPKLPAIEAILQNASNQDRNPPQLITTLIDKVPSANTFVIHELLRQFYPPSSQSKWHIRQALWQILLPLNMSQEQRYGLFATLAYTGLNNKNGHPRQGLNAFAEYGKPLDQLNAYQSATVVAITQSPTRLQKDKALVNQRATRLLFQINTLPSK